MDLFLLKDVASNFCKELQESERGIKTSLPFIIHQLPRFSLIKNQEIFQMISIGGSISQNALLRRENGRLMVLNKFTQEQPVFNTQKDLFNFLLDSLDPNITKLALNFAYPLNPVFENNKLDGILLSGSKENSFEGLINKKICQQLEKFILNKLNKEILITAANDTICLLLSGLTKFNYENLVGGVLGTGVNFAIFLGKERAVNLEVRNFDKFPISKEAKIVDKHSNHPGIGLFEKNVSGAYLYQLFNVGAKQNKIEEINSTKEMDLIIKKKKGQESLLANSILQNSAQLFAAIVAGFALFKEKNINLVMEGSLFWEGFGFKQNVENILEKMSPQYKINFEKIEDSTILGAAKLFG
ncbi:hypothetical protein HYS91_03900 [Candidatus Daviesbacteria bacterium]|nr:hypothetical protein [Candidatus Daviesbacteria bacterium]